MFNFLNKSKPNHILDVFKVLSDKQKESIVSLLIVFAGVDQEITGGITESEFSYINKHMDYFKLNNSFTILQDLGIDGVLANLKNLSDIQKKHLIAITYGLLDSDNKPNDVELLAMEHTLNKLGITTDKILDTIKSIS
jgi:hypothetical protein